MKRIEIHQFNNLQQHDAIFFTKEGIIVDKLSGSPFMGFYSTTQKLKININEVYLDATILIVACELCASDKISDEFTVVPPKNFLTTAKQETHHQILRAIHWLTWNNKTPFCSQCGDPLIKVLNLLEKKCGTCGSLFYPSLSPAVLVLVQRENQVLLARSAHFKPGVYSAFAGFIDLGESAEDAAHREVMEEAGIRIADLKYFGSQSWPFPSSFMIAFTAHYLTGNLTIQQNEIEDARWFDAQDLPALPSYPSISRALIDSWLRKHPMY